MSTMGFASLIPESTGDPNVGAPPCEVIAPSQLTVQYPPDGSAVIKRPPLYAFTSVVVSCPVYTTVCALATWFVFTSLFAVTTGFVDPELLVACAELPNPKLTEAASTPARPARRQRSQRVLAGIAARSFWIAGIFPLRPEKGAAGK